MFDDPKKELNRLDAELRAQAYEDQLEALQNQEIPELDDLFEYEDSDWLSELSREDADTPPAPSHPRGVRNDAVDFHRTVYGDETIREESAVFVEKKPRKKLSEADKESKKEKKESVGCLPFIIFLELMGIAGMLWWWYRWMR